MGLSEVPMLSALSDLFPGDALRMTVESILCGNTGGRLWSLDPGDPARLSLLWDRGNNVFSLAGDDDSEDGRRALTSVVSSQVREAALADKAAYFSVRALSANLTPLVADAFSGFLQGRREKFFYTYARPTVGTVPPIRAAGVRWRDIDRDLLQAPGLQNSHAIQGEIQWMWPSLDRYFDRGWGCAAVVDGAAICWCTAEYVGMMSCGIGINTVPEMQGRGVATATAARFVAESLARGITPHWECDADNGPSLRVAEKLGFERVACEEFLVGRFR